jgi:hypothetical protein
MKKLALLTLVVLFFGSCESNDPEPVEPVYSFTETYTVNPNHWQEDSSGNYLYYEFSEPALTRYIYENGIMNAYLKVENGLSPLPFDDFWLDNSNNKWTEQITCEFSPGLITFIFKTDDFVLDPPKPYTFLVRFMW